MRNPAGAAICGGGGGSQLGPHATCRDHSPGGLPRDGLRPGRLPLPHPFPSLGGPVISLTGMRPRGASATYLSKFYVAPLAACCGGGSCRGPLRGSVPPPVPVSRREWRWRGQGVARAPSVRYFAPAARPWSRGLHGFSCVRTAADAAARRISQPRLPFWEAAPARAVEHFRVQVACVG